MFTDLFLYGIIIPTLPFILHDRLGVPHSEIQSLVSTLLSSFALASVLFSIPSGVIADKLPARQWPFIGGLLALLGSTTLLYAGQTVPLLILARILQGISGAVVWTVGLALIRDTVGSDKLGVTIGTMFSFISVGELVAPVLGGIIYDKAGNGAVFAMAFSLLGLDFIMRLFVIEKKIARKYGLEDNNKKPASAPSSQEDQDPESGNGAGENSPLLQRNSREEDGRLAWKIPKDQPKLIQKFPILATLRNPRLLTAELVSLAHAFLIAVFDATVPTETQDLFSFSSLNSGLLFIPLCLPYLILGGVSGRGVDKYGGRIVATLGFAYMVLPLLLLRIPHAGGKSEIAKFTACLGMVGVGFSFVSSPSLVEVSYVLEQYHLANPELFGEDGPYAQLYAINSLMFSAGLTLGPVVAGELRERIGYGDMMAVVAGLCAGVAGLCWVFLGRIPKER